MNVPSVMARWVALAGFYVVFAGQLGLTEAAAGLVATVAATGFLALVRRAETQRLSLRAPWGRIVGRPLATLYVDVGRVGRVLLRVLWRRPDGPVGEFGRQAFQRRDHPAGRCGIVTLALSLAPNGYVVSVPAGVPDDEDVLVLHRLAPAAPDSDPDWPA